ncbi:MAG TPA: fumarylacetoacetate hydrolase family protein [Acidobacteriota bacterium]|jgi:2-dehydro-3-deoxy-D-arabinonate dehydratase
MKLYRTAQGPVVVSIRGSFRLDNLDWTELVNRDDLPSFLSAATSSRTPVAEVAPSEFLPPIGRQEVWAAGVTYFRSRNARMEESKSAGGGDFYDRVYNADRPELFFKSNFHRTVGHNQRIRIRRDSKWNVPEPELTLVVTSSGRIVGYTIGNDVSSREIEGENPLYLPQAKVYDQSCALGPGIWVSQEPLPGGTEIRLEILRDGREVFVGRTVVSEMKRAPETLIEFLFRDNSFPDGCFLMTGTGIVPPDTFTLRSDDEVRITIGPIGTLVNYVL